MGIRSGGRRFRMSAERQNERREKALKTLDEIMKQSHAYARLRLTESRTAEDYHKEDLRLESMIPYVKGNLPIYIHANEVRQIEAAVHWANRHDVKIILVGGKDAWRTTDLLKKYKIPDFSGFFYPPHTM